MDVDKAPAEYNAGVDWLHTFSYRGSRTSATSEHIDAIIIDDFNDCLDVYDIYLYR